VVDPGVDERAVLYINLNKESFFMELSDYYDAPINKALHFIRGVGLMKG
jgi:hypothetical protein